MIKATLSYTGIRKSPLETQRVCIRREIHVHRYISGMSILLAGSIKYKTENFYVYSPIYQCISYSNNSCYTLLNTKAETFTL